MNKNFDFSSKKFLILTGIVCVAFIIIVVNALTYLPESLNKRGTVNLENNINKPAEVKVQNEEKSSEEINEENSEQTENDTKNKKTLNVQLPKSGDEIDIIEIDTPDGANTSSAPKEEPKVVELSPEEKAENILKEAAKFRTDKQYIKALDEYQKIPSTTDDKLIIAKSYDGIASLYAINKRYGTALSYAIKAYNMAPTSAREMFLARLYYKTGDVDKATQRVNNILRRDFSDDRW